MLSTLPLTAILCFALTVVVLFILGIIIYHFPTLKSLILERWREMFGAKIPGMVAYYHFDEGHGNVAKDSSGYETHLKLYNSPTWRLHSLTPEHVMLGDAALELSPLQYAETEGKPRVEPKEGLSITLWIKVMKDLDCDGQNNWRYIVAKGKIPAYALKLEEDGRVGGVVRLNGISFELQSEGSIKLHQWTHVAFVYEVNGSARIYLNRVVDREVSTLPQPIQSNDEPIRLGGYELVECPSGHGSAPAIVDELRIYARALSPEEITTGFLGL